MSPPLLSEGHTIIALEQRFTDEIELADRLAVKYDPGSEFGDDLRQVARLGLWRACRRFDPNRGVFVRFATVTIIGELRKYLRSAPWGLRVPRTLQEDSVTVTAAVDRLTSHLSRIPRVEEVADYLGFECHRVTEALRAREARVLSSVEADDIDSVSLDDPESAGILVHALKDLPAQQRALIELRHLRGMTQAEIGRVIEVSQPEAYRRLARAEEALKESLKESKH